MIVFTREVPPLEATARPGKGHPAKSAHFWTQLRREHPKSAAFRANRTRRSVASGQLAKLFRIKRLARPAGLEPATSWFVAVKTFVDPAQLTSFNEAERPATWTQLWTQFHNRSKVVSNRQYYDDATQNGGLPKLTEPRFPSVLDRPLRHLSALESTGCGRSRRECLTRRVLRVRLSRSRFRLVDSTPVRLAKRGNCVRPPNAARSLTAIFFAGLLHYGQG